MTPTPAEVRALIERLRSIDTACIDCEADNGPVPEQQQAADALAALLVRVEALETDRDDANAALVHHTKAHQRTLASLSDDLSERDRLRAAIEGRDDLLAIHIEFDLCSECQDWLRDKHDWFNRRNALLEGASELRQREP